MTAVATALRGRVDDAGVVAAARVETGRLATEPGVRSRLGTRAVRAVRGVGLVHEKQLLGRARHRANDKKNSQAGTRGGATETVEAARSPQRARARGGNARD